MCLFPGMTEKQENLVPDLPHPEGCYLLCLWEPVFELNIIGIAEGDIPVAARRELLHALRIYASRDQLLSQFVQGFFVGCAKREVIETDAKLVKAISQDDLARFQEEGNSARLEIKAIT